ncbi:MAG TPA: ATP-binding protein [Solirubrobacterales bacterium]|jgi:two-component system OmpR family sensor kinase|nr:ATP-binding protein [Solirubrobacterales bacterium]
MRVAWLRLGLRGRLALSIAAIVLAAFAVLFVSVRQELNDESAVITHEEHREAGGLPGGRRRGGETTPLSPIEDAQAEVVRTFLIAGGLTLAAALLAGYLLAARTAAPLRRMAFTAAAVDGGDLTPRIGAETSAAVEVRTLAEAFDHMLDRLDDAFLRQRQFVSDASHELRTPLTAIRGQLEVLARAERPAVEEVRRVEGVVMTEMARVERLVDDLLTLARLDEDAPLQRREMPLAPYLRRLAEEEPLGGVTVGELAAGTLRADPDRLTQVIRNLLANARRHAGTRGRVEISAVARGARLTIRVDDDGPGIDPAERKRVFARFHRSEAARDRGSGGSGLGLAIARSIVELHGGRIWVEDSPLGGARVAFELGGFESQLGTA